MKQEYTLRTFRGKKYKRLSKIKWSKPDRQEIGTAAAEKEREFAEWAAGHEKRVMSTVYEDKKKFARDTLHFQLNEAILDPKRLRADTGQDPSTFYYMAAVLDDMMLGDVYAPLIPYGADEHKAGWKGNRCKLRIEYMLHMYLHHLRTNNSRQVLASKYGIDQAAVCRHLWRIEHALGFLGMMPTADTMSDEIRAAPKTEALELVGDVLNIDCKHTRIEAPHGKESNNRAYSGKAHTTTCNTLFVCRRDGMFVGMGSPQPGRPSDITNLRGNLPALGYPTDSFLDPGTPPGERITVNLDRAMVGIQHKWKGAGLRIPHKRRPRQKRLPPWQRRENYEMNSDRAIIETNFSRLNAYQAVGGVYRRSVGDLGSTLNVLTGVVNLQRIMGTIDPKRSHRSGRRPGRPRKRASRGRKPPKTFE